MAKMIVGLYGNLTAARKIVSDLQENGVQREDISLVAGDAKGEYARHFDINEDPLGEHVSQDASAGAAQGAGTGAVVGGVAGLLIGLGLLAIPGVGPVIAAGPLLSTITGAGIGAATGGLVGALTNAGIPTDNAEHYAESVRGGGALVSVTVPDEMAVPISDVMRHHNPIDVHETTRGGAGVTEFDHDGSTLDDQVQRLNAHTASTYAGTRYEKDERVVGAGSAVYTDQGLLDRSFMPSGTLAQATSPVGDPVNGGDYFPYETGFRDHYDAHFGTSDYEYVQYQPAYYFGYNLAMNERYRDDDWGRVEADARRDWERDHPDSTWDQFKDAVRFGWDSVRGIRA